MKLLKRGLLIAAFALILFGGVTQADAATKYKEIDSYKGNTVTVKGAYDYLTVYASTKTIKINAPKAKSIDVYNYDGKCTSVDLSKCTSAKELRISVSKLDSFKVPKNGGNIKELRISTDKKTLSIPTMKKVTYFSVSYSDNLTSVSTKNLPNLRKFVLLYTRKVSKVDISKNKKLKTIAFDTTALKSIDASKNSNLELYSVCNNDKLKTVDVTKNSRLTALQCYDNKVSTLKVGKKTRLKEVSCENNKLKSLDLSKAKNVKTVSCYGNSLKTFKLGSSKNILKKVSKTAKFDSVTIKDYQLTAKMKKTGTIQDYILFIANGDYDDELDKKSGMKYVYRDDVEDGENPKLWAISGVKYKKTMIYYYKTDYKY